MTLKQKIRSAVGIVGLASLIGGVVKTYWRQLDPKKKLERPKYFSRGNRLNL